ncbi:MAG: phytanoyl-CoA dioxygenase family protein [Polyangiales bacterium]
MGFGHGANSDWTASAPLVVQAQDVLAPDGSPTQALVEAYKREGYLVLRGLWGADVLHALSQDIAALVQLQLEHITPSAAPQRDRTGQLEDVLGTPTLALAKQRRKALGAVYDAAMKLLSVRRLGAEPRLTRLVAGLLPGALLAISNNIIVRIDLPEEDAFLFDHWHQDYPYSMVSQRGLVLWAPIRPIPLDVGPVQVLPGSHRQGLRPTTIDSRGHFVVDAAADPDRATGAAREPVQCAVDVGDVVLFDLMTVHRSARNLSPLPRWTVTFRYCDMRHAQSVREGWPSFYQQGRHFAAVHPQMVQQDHRMPTTSPARDQAGQSP